MRPCRQNPTRLADLAPENDLAGVALLIQSARQAPDEPLPLVKWRIRNSLRRRREWNRRGLRLALVGALVFLAGSVVGAIAVPLLASRLRSATPEPAETHPSSQAVRHSRRRVLTPAIPAPPATNQSCRRSRLLFQPQPCHRKTSPVAALDTPAKAKAVSAPVAPVVSVAKISKVAALHPSTALKTTRAPLAEPASLEPMPPAEASPPPPDEHSLLTTAVRRLRTAHDPASALAALDNYRVRFPSGALAPEAPCCARRRSCRLAANATPSPSWMGCRSFRCPTATSLTFCGESCGPLSAAGEKPWQISTSSCVVAQGKAPTSARQPTLKRRDAGTRAVGPSPGPQPPGRRRWRARQSARLPPPLSARPLRPRGGPPAW